MEARLGEVLIGLLALAVGSYGPKYPITAAWFRDRFTYQDWNRTLGEFQAQGGDTMFLRAPPIVRRTREDLMADPQFAWCGSSDSSTGTTGPHCYDQAMQELTALGLNVTAFVTYQYEEGFSDVIMACTKTDRVINSSRIYYQIVLPVEKFNESNLCDFPKGTKVVVLLTTYAGTDPHSLLLTAAGHRNMSVYFGLPAAPRVWGQPQGFSRPDNSPENPVDSTLLEAYYAWVHRVLTEHQARYSKVKVTGRSPEGQGWRMQQTSLYNHTLAGYYSRDEGCLAQINEGSPIVALYRRLGELVHTRPGTVQQHVHGFDVITNTTRADVIIVQVGRGWGRVCYYWPGQENATISRVDPTLDRVLHYLHPALRINLTFQEACSASNQQIFAALEQSHNALLAKTNTKTLARTMAKSKARYQRRTTSPAGVVPELCLGVEALEYLRDDPCLPLDPLDSGMGQILNRASKNRVDRALGVASARIQKVIAFAWDADFTCTTRDYPVSLATQIRTQDTRPLIAACSFHSPANRSIVIDWPCREKRRLSHLHGYHFELDWGYRHNRVPSLEYTQLYDLPNVLNDLDNKGRIKVKADGDSNVCFFDYDFSRPASPFLQNHSENGNDPRRFYRH
ncbi:hypothetical protein ACOMHN_014547 [Nucella lapillus]